MNNNFEKVIDLISEFNIDQKYNKLSADELNSKYTKQRDVLKDAFYNYVGSKWKQSNVSAILQFHNINKHELSALFLCCFSIEIREKKRHKGILNIINYITNHGNTRGSQKPISLKHGVKVSEFASEMNILRNKYLDCKKIDLIKVISKNIETGNSLDSLKKIFYDN